MLFITGALFIVIGVILTVGALLIVLTKSWVREIVVAFREREWSWFFALFGLGLVAFGVIITFVVRSGYR